VKDLHIRVYMCLLFSVADLIYRKAKSSNLCLIWSFWCEHC